MNMKIEQRLAVIGTGQMAGALVKGWIKQGLLSPHQIIGSDPSPDARIKFNAETGVETISLNAEAADKSQIILMAVKPSVMIGVLKEISPKIRPEHLIISIAAGITTKTIEEALFDGVRVVRVMPNTPALVNTMAGGYSGGRWATAEDLQLVHKLFSAIGRVYQLSEEQLDAITGLSGSGPAYCSMVLEALADGGVAAGLSRQMAIELAAQTMLGTAKMVLEMGLHPALIKDMVASPAGTTIAGIEELEKWGIRAAFMSAVIRAYSRARELGQKK